MTSPVSASTGRNPSFMGTLSAEIILENPNQAAIRAKASVTYMTGEDSEFSVRI